MRMKGKVKKKYICLVLILLLLTALIFNNVDNKREIKTTIQQESDFQKQNETPFSLINEGIKIDNSLTHQTIEGFGASYAWYTSLLVFNENKEKVYDLLFKDAKLTILRFKNAYLYGGSMDRYKNDVEIYNEAKKRIIDYGEKPIVLLSSWSPSAYLKENDSTFGGATLRKNENGEYLYQEFGEYWANLIEQYNKKGLLLDFISIQNECDGENDFENCELSFMETEDKASYSKAYLSVYKAISKIVNRPLMMGPETLSIDSQRIKLYMDEIFKEAPESIYGIIHHLYDGGTYTDPKSFIKNMANINDLYPNLPKWQTEFGRGDILETARLIQYSMFYENTSAYLYWAGIWHTGDDCLIAMDENPEDETRQGLDNGFEIREQYYALRHFSEFIRPGYKRVDTLSFDKDVSCTAYASQKNQKNMVMVIINEGKEDKSLPIYIKDYQIHDSKIYLSECNGENEKGSFYKETGNLSENGIVSIPPKSILTIVLDGNTNVVAEDYLNENKKDNGISKNSRSHYVRQIQNEFQWSVMGSWDEFQFRNIRKIADGEVEEENEASFDAAWSEDGLYICIKVKDRTKNFVPSSMNKQDQIKIFVNEFQTKGNEYGEGDCVVTVARNGKTDIFSITEELTVESEFVSDKEGYQAFIKIPWQLVKPRRGVSIGFDIQVSDFNKWGKMKSILKWCDSSLDTDTDLSAIGTLILK